MRRGDPSLATQPSDRHAVDAARRRLWGTANAGPRAVSFDTFDNLYKSVDALLEYLYNESDQTMLEPAMNLLAEVEKFIRRCNAELVGKAIGALQNGLACWIQDDKRRIGNQSSPIFAEVSG